jgi:endo-1,4-beta-xylanase
MKMKRIQGRQGEFAFDHADNFMAFAVDNRLGVCGHCLVWAKDGRTPGWFFKDGEKTASREMLLSRMKEHIQTVAGRYRGKIIFWDVVNEALADDEKFLRPSQYLDIVGDDFIARAFEYARQADPDAVLVYNDYNLFFPHKHKKLVRLLRMLVEQKAPIDAVGIQGHFELDQIPYDQIEEVIKTVRSFGLKVVVAELDIDVVLRSKWWADGGKYRDELSKYDPYADGCPPEVLERQAEQYAKLFALFSKYADCIGRVTFWNLHDGRSWLNDFPWKRSNYPLLFDGEAQFKPAFWAVLSAQ